MWFILALVNLWDWSGPRTGMDVGILMMLLGVHSFMQYEFQKSYKGKE
jgi:hypothetical protein